MSIDQKDVRHIADLARIELTAAEEQKFEKELSAILEFVEKLNEADTTNTEPMTGGNTIENIMRPDKQTDSSLEEKSSELINATPEKMGGWVKVKAVFGD
jgi:aspartyl-tRNA(Asn)/glutamyl-tRNA(Gln) amidotransferase subunit C